MQIELVLIQVRDIEKFSEQLRNHVSQVQNQVSLQRIAPILLALEHAYNCTVIIAREIGRAHV